MKILIWSVFVWTLGLEMSSMKWLNGNWVIVLAALILTITLTSCTLSKLFLYGKTTINSLIAPLNLQRGGFDSHFWQSTQKQMTYFQYDAILVFALSPSAVTKWSLLVDAKHISTMLCWGFCCLQIHPVDSKAQRAEDGFYECHWYNKASTCPLCHSTVIHPRWDLNPQSLA